jgi:hypothetical protein
MVITIPANGSTTRLSIPTKRINWRDADADVVELNVKLLAVQYRAAKINRLPSSARTGSGKA